MYLGGILLLFTLIKYGFFLEDSFSMSYMPITIIPIKTGNLSIKTKFFS